MKYQNPVLPGMYPDPSVCLVDGVYYLVNSTFEYMPAVPIFKSMDLVNWEQIGNCISHPQLIGLSDCPCSGGIFAPTIRYHENRFYLITTCFGKNNKIRNFYLTAEEPKGPWSEPVFVDLKGIDPSLFWEDGKTYIQYASFGSIKQVEIDLATGFILRGPETITKGCGGRDAEGPHMWKRNGFYYLLLAEGGTREGHMVTLMRGTSVWGPFMPSPYLPVVSNKDYAGQPLQCVGHGDWIVSPQGKNYIVALGTRPVKHQTILGRETLLTPADWTEDGWLKAKLPYIPEVSETEFSGKQIWHKDFVLDMKLKELPFQVISPRFRHDELVEFRDQQCFITGNKHTLNDEADPVLLAVRQNEYQFSLLAELSFLPEKETDEAGLTMFMDSSHHISLFLSVRNMKPVLVLRKKVNDLKEECSFAVEPEKQIRLRICGDEKKYYFYYTLGGGDERNAGWTYNKNLSSACSDSPNTGVVAGVFVIGEKTARLKNFRYETKEIK